MPKEIDHIILKKFTKGCEDAFCTIYHQFRDKIYFYCLKLVKDQANAEELVQVIFVKLWENRVKIDYKRNIEPYLFTIARNLILDHLKSKSLYEFVGISNESSDFASSDFINDLEYNEYHELANQAIENLPEMRQIIFKMKYEENRDVTEIAELLRISPNTVKSQLSKASKAIRKHLSSNL